MSSEEEMLKEKTVEDLKQLARDKDFSGYSNLRKSELIDMITDSLAEEEIRDYFSEGESTMREEDLESHIALREKIESNKIGFLILVGLIVAIAGLAIGYFYLGAGGYSTYTNENMGISFDHPTSWKVQPNPIYENILLISDQSDNTPRMIGQVSVDRKDNSIEDIKNQFQKSVENAENSSFLEEIKYIRGENGIDFTVKYEGPQGNQITRVAILSKEDKASSVMLFAPEENYQAYEEDFSKFIESFRIH